MEGTSPAGGDTTLTGPASPRPSADTREEEQKAAAAGVLQGYVTIRTLLESIAEGVVIVNAEGRIVYVNKRLELLLGFAQSELIGRHLGILIPERVRAQHEGHVAEYFNAPRLRPMGVGLELQVQAKDNRTIPVEVSLSFLKTKAGLLVLAFVMDVTERKRAEDELKRLNRDLDEFAQIVAHDLNSTVVEMVGYSQLLVRTASVVSPEEQRDFLQEIARSGRKLSDVVRELLLFSRIRKEDVEVHPLQMKDIVGEAVKRLRIPIDQRGAELRLPDTFEGCVGYGPWVEEVWLNYISNALKYGGDPPVVEVGSNDLGDGYVRYWVKDNGEGVDLPDIYALFAEGSKEKKKIIKGHGLGLLIVRRIIEKLDGRIEAWSSPGKGSTFAFDLPKSAPERPPEAARLPASR